MNVRAWIAAALGVAWSCARPEAVPRSFECQPVVLVTASDHVDQLAGAEGEAKRAAEVTRARMDLIQAASAGFCVDSGRYAGSSDELLAARAFRPGVGNCTADSTMLADGWGRGFAIQWGNHPPRVMSSGADGKPNTPDDIRSPFPPSDRLHEHDPSQLCRPSSS
jgi:hypothetical protein